MRKLPIQFVPKVALEKGMKTVLQSMWEEIGRVLNLKVEIQQFTDVPDTKPPATEVPAGTIIYVTDGGAGDKLRYSDGAVWNTIA